MRLREPYLNAAVLLGLIALPLAALLADAPFTITLATRAVILALAAVGFVTCRDLVTRRMPPEVPSMTVTLSATVAVMLFGVVTSATVEWQPVSAMQLLVLMAAALLVFGGCLCSIMAMRAGEIAFVAPFRYSGLIWALLLGWLVFGDWPDLLTMVGAAIVVGAGLFTLYRDHQRARRSAA